MTDNEEEMPDDARNIAALAVALLGLSLIAEGFGPDPQQTAKTVLEHLARRYGVHP